MEKEVFERMVAEFNEMLERVNNYREFLLDEEKSKSLDPLNRDLLVAQFKAMETYVSILSIRIGYNATAQDAQEAVTPEVVND